ncbi:hypothetical protein [Janthinobacterium sp. PAMC25594]|uniref:hypothetical protein n=1 Tax=Janthinobacterium sp. PAMC25594 TaxID=2861284 RepID=UPI001C633DB1|nr:hypothetical protein [Janthinobacterium sp. PAMC25594]QYG07376.1 hypothetical protein KY494_00645 [Janthinobacterium sp. PAMC25594]
MNSITSMATVLLMLGVCTTVLSADFERDYEEIIAALDAHVAACSELEPARVKMAQFLLESVMSKEKLQDIDCIRKTEIYKKYFEIEYGVLRTSSTEVRQRLCQQELGDRKPADQ